MSTQKIFCDTDEVISAVNKIERLDIKDIATKKWFDYDDVIQKLAIKSFMCAERHESEFIKDNLIEFEKIPILVHNLVIIEFWREKILKYLLTSANEDVLYFYNFILNNELNLCNLLEIILFYPEAVEELNDTAIDLAEYCHGSICRLVQLAENELLKPRIVNLLIGDCEGSQGTKNETCTRIAWHEYQTGLKSLNIIRYLIENSCNASENILPGSISKHLLVTLDVPMVLVRLFELRPWYLSEKHEWQENGSITKKCSVVSKSEGQLWLALYTILMNKSTIYDLKSNYRREAIMKLRSYLTDVRIDVLPILSNLRYCIETMSLGCSDCPSDKFSGLYLIECIPEVREGLIKKYKDLWDVLAMDFLEYAKSYDGKQTIQKGISRWLNFLENDETQECLRIQESRKCNGLKEDEDEKHFCAFCNETSSLKCSRCKNVWYCSKACQIQHWKRHKAYCTS